VSVALLILAVGFFYFEQMQSQLVKKEHFSLIEYARHIKMNEILDEFSGDYHHEYIQKKNQHINIRNFEMNDSEFSKFIPMESSEYYLKVYKSKDEYIANISQLKVKIIFAQILLLVLFASISYFLARKALYPLKKAIHTLDKFAKDLIHDLNTPVGAMKLNIKILEKNQDIKELKALQRLKISVDTISELKESLTTLLEKKTFQVRALNVCAIAQESISLHQQNYPKMKIQVSCSSLIANVNENALKQILHNLLSNACKYNVEDGSINVFMKDKALCIQDSGFGIKEPSKIFDREYSAQNSTGLGLDIVKRLAEAMNITIDVKSDENGSLFCLHFQK